MERLDQIFQLAEILSNQSDFQEALRVTTETASAQFNAAVVSIVMINPDTQNTVKTVIRESEAELSQQIRLIQSNVIGWCLKNRQPLLSRDIRTDERFNTAMARDFPGFTIMSAPLLSQGEPIGYLVAMTPSPAVFSESDFADFQRIALISTPYIGNIRKIQMLFNKQLPDAALISKYNQMGLIGKSPAFVEMLKSLDAAAACDVRVLLQGRSGTGKEKIARAIHQFSVRSSKTFIAVDCGAIPVNLLESEFFGHVKGAFTGANQARTGLFEAANGGTLFLDEISNLPLEMQAKFLRVLQEEEVRPVGSNTPRKIDVRIITACSSDLQEMVAQGSFREDLFYRLYVYPIQVPTLNQRREDIPLLAAHFLKCFAEKQGKKVESIAEMLQEFLQLRVWTGNIRELENFIERLVALVPRDRRVLDETVLPPDFRKEYKELVFSKDAHPIRKPLTEILEETEASLIRQALVANDWNQSAAARVLQISERALRYKMEKLGIVRPN